MLRYFYRHVLSDRIQTLCIAVMAVVLAAQDPCEGSKSLPFPDPSINIPDHINLNS